MKLETTISIDVISNENGTYDTYISTENSSGSHYNAIDAKTIGEYTADLIDCLEEEASGNTYLSNNNTSTDNVELLYSDGETISRKIFNKFKNAKEVMFNEYKAWLNTDNADDARSTITEAHAVIYTDTKTLCWQIYPVN